jgi:hypothetical protein
MQVIESGNEIKEHAADWFESVTEYIEARWTLGVLDFSEKSAHLFSKLATGIIIGIFGAMLMLFISIGAAFYIGKLLDSYASGFVIIALFYGVLGGVCYAIRNTIIKQKISNTFIKTIYHEK